jgi:hypothetical protein
MDTRPPVGVGRSKKIVQIEQVYQSFLIRCWLIPPATADEPPAWRFELQEVTAESPVQRFGSFTQLHEYLAARLTAVVGEAIAGAGAITQAEALTNHISTFSTNCKWSVPVAVVI